MAKKTWGEEFLEWVDTHHEEIKNANAAYLHGSDSGLQQLDIPEIAEHAYSSDVDSYEYDENDNIVVGWCEYGECEKGDIIFGSY